jgi:hypothetical protein
MSKKAKKMRLHFFSKRPQNPSKQRSDGLFTRGRLGFSPLLSQIFG